MNRPCYFECTVIACDTRFHATQHGLKAHEEACANYNENSRARWNEFGYINANSFILSLIIFPDEGSESSAAADTFQPPMGDAISEGDEGDFLLYTIKGSFTEVLKWLNQKPVILTSMILCAFINYYWIILTFSLCFLAAQSTSPNILHEWLAAQDHNECHNQIEFLDLVRVMIFLFRLLCNYVI